MKNYIQYIDYNDQKSNILGELTVDIKSAGWTAEKAKFLVVPKARCLMGLDLQNRVGIETIQRSYEEVMKEKQGCCDCDCSKRKLEEKQCNTIEAPSTELPSTDKWVSEHWQGYFQKKYGHVFTRQGRSKNHVVTTNFFSPLIPIQEKGRRILVHNISV